MFCKSNGKASAEKRPLRLKVAGPAVIFCLLFIFAFLSFADARPPVTLTILHVNDTHGHILPAVDPAVDRERPVGGAAWLARMIEDERGKNPAGTLLLSGGDMFQGTAISNVFRGQPVIEIMNALKFDAMAIGNHEFDWGMKALKHLQAAARFPFLSANIVSGKGKGLSGVKPVILLKRKGLKIALIGITTTDTPYTTKPDNVKGLSFLPPREVLPPIIGKMKAEGAHLIIVLSHSGLNADKKMAEDVPGIDVIVGGHSHTAVTDPVLVGKTIIVQAGCYGLYLGVLNLEVDPQSGEIAGYTKREELKTVYSGPDDPYDPAIARLAASYHDRIKDRFAAVIGETEVDLVRTHPGESNIGDLVCDAMREAAKAEIAFHNSGGLRANIPKGKITTEQAYALLPFDNVLVSMDLSGKQVLRVLEKGVETKYGVLQVSGLRVAYDMSRPAGERVKEATVNGVPLSPDRTYRIVTNDYLAAGGDRFSAFRKGKNIRCGDTLRDVFVGYLKKHSPVRQRLDGRIVIRP